MSQLMSLVKFCARELPPFHRVGSAIMLRAHFPNIPYCVIREDDVIEYKFILFKVCHLASVVRNVFTTLPASKLHISKISVHALC